MGLFGKQHKKDAAEYVLKKASDYHEAFGTTAAIYNEDSEQIEALPADKYEVLTSDLSNESSGWTLTFTVQIQRFRKMFN